MSTSASEDSSRKWILSNPVIDNPIYDFFEEPIPHSLPIFDTEDHTYTYLVDASILTKSMFSRLPNAEFSQNDHNTETTPTKLDLDAEGANVELSQNDKLDLNAATDPPLPEGSAELSQNDKSQSPSKKDLDAVAAPPLPKGSTAANDGLSKSEIPSKKDLDAGANADLSQTDKSESSIKNKNLTAAPLEQVIHRVATQHVIVVETGEDVAEKIISLAKDGPKSVNILSATGKIAKVIITRRQAEIETHEGLYNIVSLSGSFKSDELGVTGGLYISLATDYGISFKGRVAGALTAASPVEVTIRIVTSEES
ncbi:AT-hook motif nuclear-localized protein 3 [Solanum stenotomum]|uniref:AT-hook motif nuclear-localized protein 3 n=1 Tax=Solanum stenotomum TaxID=172797 RepID=UPI0020CFF39A|nr:AT-hook motif nuclear-localized protein 3 [Solanum stenotomum]